MRYYQEAAVGDTYPFLHGNGTKRITIQIQADGSIRYYDTDWRDTLTDCAADTWILFEIRNISFTAGTYDIWYNGTAIKTGAAMQTTGNDANVVDLTGMATATQDVFYDNVVVRKFAATAQTFTFGAEQTPTPEITNTPNSKDFGILEVNTTSATSISYFTLNNTGNCAVDITIQATNLTGGDDTWTLSGNATPGENIYGLYAGLDDADDNFDVVVNTTANAFVSSLAEATTQAWGLKLYMPTSVANYDAQQMSGNITLVASVA
jgi:hypothetical protein